MRYLWNFGLLPGSGLSSRPKLLILAAYALGLGGVLLAPAVRRRKGALPLLILALIQALGLTVIDGPKQEFYLVHTVPFFLALFALWFEHFWTHARSSRWALAALLAAIVLVQLSVSAARVRQNRYRAYVSAARFLESRALPPRLIMASAEFAFELGFDGNLVDDFRLGFRTGRRPDLIVMDDQRYGEWIPRLRDSDPANYRYIRTLLSSEYDIVYDSGLYRIYARRPGS